jgi:peptidoglycan/xylan/chitin deacetylase (PgdA/CDA1 family)
MWQSLPTLPLRPGSGGAVQAILGPVGTGATLREGVRGAVRVVAAAADRVLPPPAGVTLLIYHQVSGPRPGVVNLPLDLFTRQMEALAQSGRVLSLDAALGALAEPDTWGPASSWVRGANPVVVTFDDGTADFVDHALPVLVEHKVPATLYLATRWVEEGRAFWDDGPSLSWAALAEALSTGVVTVGSHTHSHLHANTVSPADYVADIDRSLALIDEHLGVSATHFAYPKALPPTPAVDAVVRARFASAALSGCQANPVGTDPYRLSRSPLQVGDGMTGFWRKADGGMRLEDAVRSALSRMRSRVRGAGGTR